MLKLNLLPSGYKQGGSVQSVAFLVLVVWLLLLAAMGFYAWGLKGQTADQVKVAADQDATIKHIADLKASQDAYDAELAKIKPETEFLNQVAAEPRQITDIMRIISRATPGGVVIQSYSLAPGKSDITLNAFAMNYAAANRWRFDLYTDPDFTDVKFPSLAGRGGCGASANAGGGAGGMGGGMGGGYPGMGGKGPSISGFAGAPGPSMGGGMGGGGGSTSQSSYPCSKFPDGRTLAVTVVIKTPYTEPTFPPADSSGGASAGGGMGGMGGGYPGMGGGGGGYPGMGGGGGGYPGMSGGTPPSSGSSSTGGTTTTSSSTTG